MMKKMNEKMKNRKGFTLVELVVVIAILGILAAIAIPKLSQSRTNAANSAHNANVRTLESAATMFIAEKGAAEVDWPTEVTWKPYLQEWPTVPAGAKETDGTALTDKYEVTITDQGEITVEPGAIDLEAVTTP